MELEIEKQESSLKIEMREVNKFMEKRRIKKIESEFLFSLGVKYCSKCGQIKELDKFNKNKSFKDGLASWCKECSKKYQKKYQKEYRQTEKSKKFQKEYQKEYKQQSEPKKKFLIRGQTYREWGTASTHLCAYCGQKAAQWHHQRYDSRWREGCVPLCLECHKKIPKVCETFQE